MSTYAWIIDKDHLTGPEGEFANPDEDEAGTTGPSNAPDILLDKLKHHRKVEAPWHTRRFRIYDDDHVLYYSGRLITDDPADEDVTVAPLRDFGTPNAGAVLVEYDGHPEMDSEWY